MIQPTLYLPTWLLTLSVALHLVTGDSTFVPYIIYANEHCRRSYLVDRSIRIRLTRLTFLISHTQCMVTLRPQNLDTLFARFIEYHIDDEYVGSKSTCHVHSLHLGQGSKSIWGPVGYCGTDRPTEQYNLGPEGVFGYRTDFGVRIKAMTVELLVTEVKKKKPPDTCPPGYFDCKRHLYCVDFRLTCNGYNECGNDMDEVELCGTAYVSWLIPLLLGITAVIIFSIILASVNRQWATKEEDSKEESEIEGQEREYTPAHDHCSSMPGETSSQVDPVLYRNPRLSKWSTVAAKLVKKESLTK